MRVFLTSPWVPAEWIRAHGLASRGIWFVESFRPGATPLAAGTCALADSVVRFAETHPDDAVVFTTACDQLRRGFDTSAPSGTTSKMFLFNLPATPSAPAAQIYRTEIERLGHFLVELGGVTPTAAALRQEIRQTNDIRCRLRETATSISPRRHAECVANFHDQSDATLPPTSPTRSHVPLALLGGPLCRVDWDLFDAIETAGGRIALNATLTGERSLCPSCDDSTDPIPALISGYWNHLTDVFQRPNTRLYTWLEPRLCSRQVRGLILWAYTSCDLWRAEWQTLREMFGLPVLLLEAGAPTGISPRDQTRLQAFVETLR